MAKDYFQDIIPPSNEKRSVPITNREQPLPSDPTDERDEHMMSEPDMPDTPERSIRNISAPLRAQPRVFPDTREKREIPPPMHVGRPARRRNYLLWILAFLSLIVVGGLLLFALRPTTITVTPRTHTVVFDQTSTFTAYPATTGAEGSLVYSVQTIDLEDSEAVASTGSVRAEEKARGMITVYNSYSVSPVRLIKETRFQTAAGLVFRTPAEVMVPGRSGSTPGKVDVTVIADQAGEQYNVGPTDKFTLPGLQSSSDMYRNVYAQSTNAMTGGFVGDRPGVSESDRAQALAQVRSRLEQKVAEAIDALNTDDVTAFAGIAQITYEELPQTADAGNSVRIRQKAHALVPVFVAPELARAVARTVSADADVASIQLRPMQGFMAHSVATSTLGAEPLQFTMTGQALLVWGINEAELTTALAGKDKDAFQTIVTGFPGVEEARARIQPFWSSTFPSDSSKIRVKITEQAQ